MNKSLMLVAAAVLAGCASKPQEIQAQYVSPMEYQDYSCNQISGEMRRVSRRSTDLYGQLDKTASNDQAQMAVGLILFWPTLFFLEGGDGPQAAEYARMKGEVDALEQAAIQKDCNTQQFAEYREKEAEAIATYKEKNKAQQEDSEQEY